MAKAFQGYLEKGVFSLKLTQPGKVHGMQKKGMLAYSLP